MTHRLEYHQAAQRRIHAVLRELQALPYASRIQVFGSAARGKRHPGDIDAMLVFSSPEEFYEASAYRDLVQIARRHYGCFDPFVRAGRRLYTRSDDACWWMRARKAREIWANFKREHVPLLSVAVREFELDPDCALCGAA